MPSEDPRPIQIPGRFTHGSIDDLTPSRSSNSTTLATNQSQEPADTSKQLSGHTGASQRLLRLVLRLRSRSPRVRGGHADRIDLKVLSGGLFSGPKSGPIGAYPHIPGANARISQLTGVAFGDDYQQVLEDGTRVMDSTDTATGLVALRSQAPERQFEIAGALQRAWYVDRRDLSDV
jgi:protein-disulfide isomerase-like protein with CxxC motif